MLRHAIIVHGTSGSGKSTWIHDHDFEHYDYRENGRAKTVEDLAEKVDCCICLEMIEADEYLVDELETCGWSVSFKFMEE